MHWRGIYRDDPDALVLAKRWSKVSAVLFAIGAVSGTVLSFEFGLLWPGLMSRFGDVLGLPFAFEGLAFFLEAIFLGIYLYGWGRIPPKQHLLMLVPMGITGVVGTFCVLAVNGWMNNPTGFRIEGGEVVDVQPWWPSSTTACGCSSPHVGGGLHGRGLRDQRGLRRRMLRGRRDRHHRLGFTVPFVFATVAALLQPVIATLLGSRLASTQPAKLAAFELALETESPSPLRLGGLLVDRRGPLRPRHPLPRLAHRANSFTEPVQGLDTIPVDEQPPVNITHLAFQSMVGIGTLLALAVVVFWLARWRGHDLLGNRWFLRGAVLAGPLAVVALEAAGSPPRSAGSPGRLRRHAHHRGRR